MSKNEELIVTDWFVLRQQGLVLIGKQSESDVSLRINDLVEITRPDASVISSRILGIENLTTVSGQRMWGLLLEGNWRKEDVPAGSVIRLVTD